MLYALTKAHPRFWRPRALHLSAAISAAVALSGGGISPAWSAVAEVAPYTTAASVTVEDQVLDALARNEQPAVLVKFRGKADLSAAFSISDPVQRTAYVHETLSQFAATKQSQSLQLLRNRSSLSEAQHDFTVLWVNNSIAIKALSAEVLAGLQADSNVESIRVQREIPLDAGNVVESGPELNAVVASVTRIKAPDVWALGHKGAGIILANIDSGVRHNHAALVNQYRGNIGGGTFDHAYNWFDPYNYATTPRYTHAHGTHTMGTMVGDNGTTEQIGVAPESKWINCIGFGLTNAGATDAGLLACGQWMIAPTDMTGNAATADPSKRPDVVNNSWGDCETSYDNWYEDVIDGWIAAGIAPVFSNGNNSNCGYASNPPLNTVGNPARSGKVLGIGSTSNASGAYASHSNKGPTDNANPGTAIYPDARGFANLKPNLSAPGVSIRSATSTSNTSYGTMTGTSMSSPAVTGVIGLMWSAAPCLKGNYARTGTILMETANAIPVNTGSPSDGPGNVPNQATGWGEVDALAAVNASIAFCSTAGTDPVASVTPTALSISAPQSGSGSTPLNIDNTGGGSLTFAITESGGSTPVDCENPSDIPWLSASPSSGSVSAGVSQNVTVSANPGSLAQGTYSANVCVATNDSDNPMTAVPVTLTVTPPVAPDPEIVCSAPINHSIDPTFDGSSANWLTGVIEVGDAQVHWNPYNNNGLSFYWPTSGGGGGVGAGSVYSVLAPGAVIGPASTFLNLTATAATAGWKAGVDGYLGFRFNNTTTSQINYGYVRLQTTASTGFPATIVDYCYNNAGAAITIPSGGTPDVAPTVSKAFAPASVATGANSTATVTLTNTNATAATLTAALVDTLPSGLVASAATTTCSGGTASFTAGTFTLSSGASIPANGSCTVSATVSSATAGSYVNTIAAGALQTSAGNNAAAASATLTVTEGAVDPNIVCSAEVNHSIAATIDGTSVNWLAGTIIDGDIPGNHFNPYLSGGRLLFYWNATTGNGGVASTTTGPYEVLAAGAVIGPSSTFSLNANGANNETAAFLAGVDGYLGFRFTNTTTSQPNYGYVRLQTTAPTGFPAKIVSYCYNNAGAAITIPSGGMPDVAPTVSKAFAPASVATGANSTATVTLTNTNATAATLTAALVDTLPSGLVASAATTTCPGGTASFTAGSFTLSSGASIPASGSCTVSATVSSATVGSYVNTIAAGALQTSAGNNVAAASATLTVTAAGPVFPAPYCSVTFPSNVEPISRVVVSGIDNASSPAVGGTPALENFLSVPGGNVTAGIDYPIVVEGNTDGDFTNKIVVYADWNQNGVFDANERNVLSDLVNSTGADGKQADGTLKVPYNAVGGPTRMRVLKRFSSEPAACNAGGYGQAEDYTLNVTPETGSPIANVSPLTGFDFTVEQGSTGDDTLVVGNTGTATLAFEIKRALAPRPTSGMSKRSAVTEENDRRKASRGFETATLGKSELVSNILGRPLELSAEDISQMVDNTPAALNGVGCGSQKAGASANSWWRRFYFDEHDIAVPATINSVTVASESGVNTPVTIRVYSIPSSVTVDTIPTAQLTLLGSGTGTVGGDLTTTTVPINGGVTIADTVNNDLVVEYSIEGGAGLPRFFPGGNPSAQTHKSFISAASCSIPEPVTTDSIGFPDFHVIMVVNVDTGPTGTTCASPSNVPWLSVNPANGLVAPSASRNVGVTVNAGTLDVGTYSGLLCMTTNDPVRPTIEMPVSMTVEARDVIFQNGFDGAPVDSDVVTGTINLPVAANADGSTFDFVTGVWGTYSASRVDNVNFYLNAGVMYVYWYGDAVDLDVGGVVDSGGAEFAVLQPGATIGPNSTFLATSQALTNWIGGANGYVGVAFKNSQTGQLNYGYLHLTTTGPTGFPAQALEYAYNKAGNPITIPQP